MELKQFIPSASQRFLSLDFGEGYLKILYGKYRTNGIELIAYDMRRLVFAGEKKGEIIDFITHFIAKYAIDEKNVLLTVSDADSITIKHLTLPQMPQDALSEAILAQFKNESLFLKENALLDWQVVREFADASGLRRQELVCVFARSAILDRCVSILRDCRLQPLRISSSAFNYAHILRKTDNGAGLVAIFDMGFRDATLSIYRQYKLMFVRNLAFSSDKMTQTMTGSIITESGTLELSYEKAEEIKKACGIPVDENQQIAENVYGRHILSLLQPFLEGLTRELRVSMDYFSQHFNAAPSQLLYIVGGGANIKNLPHFLGRNLNMEVCVLPLPSSVDVHRADQEHLKKDQCQLMSSIGAGLSDAQSVDLSPLNVQIEKIEEVERISLKFSFLLLAGIFLCLLAVVKLQAYQYRVRLENMRMHVQALAQVGALKGKIDEQRSVIYRLREDKISAAGVLRVFGSVTPHGVILDEIMIDQTQHAVVITGMINGQQKAAELTLKDFIGNLKKSSLFSEVSVMFSRMSDEGREFQVQCALAY
jgi:type IV pilus assembly protein PilM